MDLINATENVYNKTAKLSQQLIGEAMVRLLQSSAFADISISMLCKEAQVSRQTFYTLFGTKENVLIFELRNSCCFEPEEKKTSCRSADFRMFCHGYSKYIIQKRNILELLVKNEMMHHLYDVQYKSIMACDHFMRDVADNDRIYLIDFIAGGMNSAVKVCDIVISNEVLPHDLDLHFLVDYPPYCGIYKADERLIEAAEKICSESGIKSFRGRVVSGECFISSNEVKKSIQEKLDPYAVDMESSAIGHCCYLNETPFVSVRSISDNADDEGAMSFDEFEKIAAKRVADIVLRMTEIL